MARNGRSLLLHGYVADHVKFGTGVQLYLHKWCRLCYVNSVELNVCLHGHGEGGPCRATGQTTRARPVFGNEVSLTHAIFEHHFRLSENLAATAPTRKHFAGSGVRSARERRYVAPSVLVLGRILVLW